MLNEPTIEKLKALRLDAMGVGLVGAAEGTPARPSSPSTSASVSSSTPRASFARTVVSPDSSRRQSSRSARRASRTSTTRPSASWDKAVIRQLATCRWVQEHQNVIITGMTGVGKTYVACALAQHACRRGFSAIYRRASRLFDELTLARADGSYARLLSRFARTDVVVIDDWGLAAAREQERHDLLEILEDRYGTRSTIMTSQIPASDWHDYLGDATVADAILDRVLHNAHRLVIKGPSRRKENATAK
jgi:DNA replication protein DnaC